MAIKITTVNPPYLKNLAAKKGVDIGACVAAKFLNNKAYKDLIKREFNILTLENELGFKFIHPLRNKYDFSLADKIISFAKKNKLKVRGHILVWHHKAGLPDWIYKGKFTKEELTRILQDHMTAVVGHCKRTICTWNVVNEAIDDSCELRESIWLRTIGSDYVEKAFRFAHKANPNAKLFYNDYRIDDLNEKSAAVYELIKNLLKEKVPIHGVGLQMHLLEESPPNPKSVEKNIRRFQKLGLEVEITEMDVRIKKPVTQKKLENQARIYHEIMKVALKTRCKTFIMWGVSDANSWIPYWFKQYNAALIFDKNYRPKPAYAALKRALR